MFLTGEKFGYLQYAPFEIEIKLPSMMIVIHKSTIFQALCVRCYGLNWYHARFPDAGPEAV